MPTDTNNMYTGLALATLVSSGIAGKFLQHKAREIHKKLVESTISNNARLNQPHNIQQLNKLLEPDYI